MFMSLSPDLYVEALSPIVMVFEDVAFGRSSGLEVMSMGPWSYGISAFVRRDTEALGFSPHEDTARSRSSASQDKSSHQEPERLPPWLWISQPPELLENDI